MKIVKGERRFSQSEIRKIVAAEERGRAKIPSPQPPSFLPARAQILEIGVGIFLKMGSNFF